MKKILPLIVLVVLLFQSTSLVAQDKKIGNGIYFAPEHLFYPEIMLSYEQFIKNNLSLTYSIGYKIPTNKGNVFEPFSHGLWAGYEYQYIFNPYSHGIYISAAPAYYWDKRRRFYLQAEPFYRHYWINDKKFSFINDAHDSFNATRSERIHIVGLKVLGGLNLKINISSNKALNFKVQGGLRAMYKNYTYENIDNRLENGTIIPFERKKGNVFIPAVHLGFKIGLVNLTP